MQKKAKRRSARLPLPIATRRVLLTLEVETNLSLSELEDAPKMTVTSPRKYLRLVQIQANVIRGTRQRTVRLDA